jgi:hypothetical protein
MAIKLRHEGKFVKADQSIVDNISSSPDQANRDPTCRKLHKRLSARKIPMLESARSCPAIAFCHAC